MPDYKISQFLLIETSYESSITCTNPCEDICIKLIHSMHEDLNLKAIQLFPSVLETRCWMSGPLIIAQLCLWSCAYAC